MTLTNAQYYWGTILAAYERFEVLNTSNGISTVVGTNVANIVEH